MYIYQVKNNKLLRAGVLKETMTDTIYIIAAKGAINQATLKWWLEC